MLNCMVHNRTLWTSTVLVQNISRLKEIKMADNSVRWAFNTRTWKPRKEEILAASSFIQLDEKQRISRYVFQDDAKSSLIGRLMLRKFIHMSTKIAYEDIKLGRDDRGKPYLQGIGDVPVSFNISHQGDYVVLAGNTERNIGIDVMKIEPPANKNIPEFFRLMNRQFSNDEWRIIRGFSTELEQIACFYRMWCLKESYVKNIGVGITIPLDEICFEVKTLTLNVGEIITDTILFEKGVLKDDWIFEESLLDDKHAVAVSLQVDRKTNKTVPYKFMVFEELVKEAKPLFETDPQFAHSFMNKEIKHF